MIAVGFQTCTAWDEIPAGTSTWIPDSSPPSQEPCSCFSSRKTDVLTGYFMSGGVSLGLLSLASKLTSSFLGPVSWSPS